MNQRFLRLVQMSAFVLDLLALNIMVLFFHWFLDRTHISDMVGYYRFWMWLNISWMLVAYFTSVYREGSLSSYERFCRITLHTYFYWLAVVMVYLFFARQFQLSRVYIFSVVSCQGAMLLFNRFVYIGIRQFFRNRQFLVKKVMIVGYNETSKKLVRYLEEQGSYREVVGFCEEIENIKEVSNYPILGSIAETIVASELHGVQEIYSTISPEQDRGIYQLMHEADRNCIHFKVIPDLSFYMDRSFHIEYLRDMPVLAPRKEPLEDAANRAKKRMFDIVVSGLILLLVMPWLVTIIGLLIKLESKGPIFFRQLRTGRNNKSFYCIKFRSMRMNNDAHHKQATKGDCRLTRIGRFLRRTNLDEMPQFINSFRGEMSIVGPRPHMLKHTEDFSKLVDQYMVRQFVKPGITGWAQVNGYRGETIRLGQLQGRVNHDLWYAENWSLWLDLRICFLTVWTTLRGDKNAY